MDNSHRNRHSYSYIVIKWKSAATTAGETEVIEQNTIDTHFKQKSNSRSK